MAGVLVAIGIWFTVAAFVVLLAGLIILVGLAASVAGLWAALGLLIRLSIQGLAHPSPVAARQQHCEYLHHSSKMALLLFWKIDGACTSGSQTQVLQIDIVH